MNNIEIRDLRREDISINGKWSSFLRTLSEFGKTKISSDDGMNTLFERQHRGIRTLVALVNKEIIGTASVFIEPKFIHNGCMVGHVEDVAILEDYQKTGIGRMLMQAVIDIAKANNCYKVVLHCLDKVKPFYEKLGFTLSSHGMRLDL